jgi:uncharacterized membrane protein
MDAVDPRSPLARLLAWDAARAGLPGEHALAAAAGVALLAARPREPVLGALALAAGLALLVRAATGRGGLVAALERRSPPAAGFVEVAAPWPHDRRVRVTPPRRVERHPRA